MAAPSYGLPNGGNVNTFSPEFLASLYPYVTFGPNLASQLANLQFGAGLDAQNQNNQLALQLAQGAASNRLADNIASKLAIQGLGNVPGFGSAFGGTWGVNPVQVPNLMGIYNQFNQGLGQSFGGFGLGGQQVPGMSPVGQNPYMPTQANPQTALAQLAAQRSLRSGQDTGPFPGFGGTPITGSNDPRFEQMARDYQNQQDQLAAQQNAVNKTSGTRSLRTGQDTGFGFGGPRGSLGGGFAPGMPQNFQGWGTFGQNPFAQAYQLAGFGGPQLPGQGPSQFNLGMGIPAFGAPRATLNQYYGATPDQREAQDYFAQLAGYSPQQLAYERQFFTPGAMRTNRGFGF